jgi:hypothetical protein
VQICSPPPKPLPPTIDADEEPTPSPSQPDEGFAAPACDEQVTFKREAAMEAHDLGIFMSFKANIRRCLKQ